MRAAVCSGLNERLAIEDVELREPGAREVVVRIDATAVCITDALAIGGFTLVEPPAGRLYRVRESFVELYDGMMRLPFCIWSSRSFAPTRIASLATVHGSYANTTR